MISARGSQGCEKKLRKKNRAFLESTTLKENHRASCVIRPRATICFRQAFGCFGRIIKIVPNITPIVRNRSRRAIMHAIAGQKVAMSFLGQKIKKKQKHT